MKRTMLSRLLSKRGFCSRKDAVMIIRSGKVKVNDKLIQDPLEFVYDNSRLSVNGKLIEDSEKVYFVMNKPEDYVVSNKDDRGRKTVFDLLKFKGHLFAVGRLDIDTSGLLILTNDTEFSDEVLNPENKVPKKYLVRVNRVLSRDEIRRLKNGVLIGDYTTKGCKVKVINPDPKNFVIEMEIYEGKFHQIKYMIRNVGAKVLDLNRISVGGLYIGNLKKGEYKKMGFDEVYGTIFK